MRVLILILASVSALAQARVEEAWVARYNGPGNSADWAEAIAVDAEGNVYVTGSSFRSGHEADYATIKYSSTGAELWVARYNTLGKEYAHATGFAVDDAGNVYVTGYTAWDCDYATIKYSPDGTELWVATYDGPGNGCDQAMGVAFDTEGNVYVTGRSEGTGTSFDYATIKYSPDGNELWVARYDGPGNHQEWPHALAVDDAGNAYVTGWSMGSGTGGDYATIKYSPAGEELWVARYDGPGNDGDAAYALAVDGPGNVYVTGGSVGAGTDYDYATIKYNPAGEELWVARYNGPGDTIDYAYALALDDAGNVYVIGQSDGSGTGGDYATIKYGPAGEELWVARYNGPGNGGDAALALALDDAGNVYVTGWSTGSGTGTDCATIKYSPDGDELWVMRYDGPASENDMAHALAVDGPGNVYVTGGSMSSGANLDYATIKYVPAIAVEHGRPEAGPMSGFSLGEGSPNPFSSRVTIRYSLPTAGAASFRIYDASGRLVRALSAGPNTPGTHTVTWDGRDEQGRNLNAGVYLVRLNAGDLAETRKIVKTE